MTVNDLEARLGDPADAANPLGFAAVLDADERGELLAAGEQALRDYNFNAELVPAALGGRLVQADRLAHTVRAVFRRDSALGIGYGVTSFIGSIPVWTSGTAEQQAGLAALLLGGGRVAAAYTELPHGADFTRAELVARRAGGELFLNGRKDLINNVSRADAVLVFARTDAAPGSRSHSHLLVDRAMLPADRHTIGPRFRTSGVRGCLLSGIEFRDCPVPVDTVVGGPEGGLGAAMETLLRAFQVTRSVLPSMVIGGLDTELRTATRFARGRRLYGRTVAELPHSRTVLTGAFLDLLICDSLATVVARALHVLPEQTSVAAAAVKYLVPKLLQDAGYDLSVLIGARSYLRTGDFAIFQKHMRDIPVVTLAHASSAVCLASMVPQLPQLALRGWDEDAAGHADPRVFEIGAELSRLDFGALALTCKGRDDLAGELLVTARELAADPVLGPLCATFTAELRYLRTRCGQLPPRERTVIAGRRSFDLAARYAHVLAAAACLGVWRRGTDPFLADPRWVVGALNRLAVRLGREPVDAGDAERFVFAELSARFDGGLSFDLIRTVLAG
jgi:alkylation response protein AidB-like acyl-CoA dehydrogenase